MTFDSLEGKKCFLFIVQMVLPVCPPSMVKGRTAFSLSQFELVLTPEYPSGSSLSVPFWPRADSISPVGHYSAKSRSLP